MTNLQTQLIEMKGKYEQVVECHDKVSERLDKSSEKVSSLEYARDQYYDICEQFRDWHRAGEGEKVVRLERVGELIEEHNFEFDICHLTDTKAFAIEVYNTYIDLDMELNLAVDDHDKNYNKLLEWKDLVKSAQIRIAYVEKEIAKAEQISFF